MTTLAPTIYTRTFPRTADWLRDMILIVLGALFVAVLAQVKIALPFTPIPLTGQTFAVLLVGAALGSNRGAASMALYMALGALGLPVFAGGAAGMAYLSRRDARLPDRLRAGGLCYWSAGRTGPGKKRAHIHYPFPGWDNHYLRLWSCLAGRDTWEFQQGPNGRIITVPDR